MEVGGLQAEVPMVLWLVRPEELELSAHGNGYAASPHIQRNSAFKHAQTQTPRLWCQETVAGLAEQCIGMSCADTSSQKEDISISASLSTVTTAFAESRICAAQVKVDGWYDREEVYLVNAQRFRVISAQDNYEGPWD